MSSRDAWLCAAAMALLAPTAAAVSEQDRWQAEYRFATAEPELIIENVWGDVEVRGVAGNTISVIVSEHRSARDAATLERSRELIYLEVSETDTGVAFIVDGVGRNWRGRNPCPSCRVEYRFEVEVPSGSRVEAGTVNDGSVRIVDVAGPVTAGNVNGPVSAYNIKTCETLSTVNGDVRAEFGVAPGSDCALETINGDIITVLPANSGIDLRLELGHGRVYSEFELDSVALAPTVERIERGSKRGYRIEQPAGLRLGAGGPQFKFESLNGDVQIKRSEP